MCLCRCCAIGRGCRAYVSVSQLSVYVEDFESSRLTIFFAAGASSLRCSGTGTSGSRSIATRRSRGPPRLSPTAAESTMCAHAATRVPSAGNRPRPSSPGRSARPTREPKDSPARPPASKRIRQFWRTSTQRVTDFGCSHTKGPPHHRAARDSRMCSAAWRGWAATKLILFELLLSRACSKSGQTLFRPKMAVQPTRIRFRFRQNHM